MPIHCIIEVSRDLNEVVGNSHKTHNSSEDPTHTKSGNRGNGNGPDSISSSKDCPGESTASQVPVSGNGGKGIVEVDDFVIIPVGTPFHDLVTTVLTLHGYPKDIIRQAEGNDNDTNVDPIPRY